jgi:pyruvate formate lyase activating enzyme
MPEPTQRPPDSITEPGPDGPDSDRRKFIKQCVMGGCGIALGAYTGWDLVLQGGNGGLRVGFRNDAPQELWKWSREADWYQPSGAPNAGMVRCMLCPHECILSENDRGFCRVRVVKNGRLHTIAYGNPCAVHLDPIEKKPLYHFLPGTSILSIATAGCNLRCRNCQNWEISQSRPEDTRNYDLLPAELAQVTSKKKIPSIAYTYSEPLIFYEYVVDTAEIARRQGVKNVLVTAGYILEEPLRRLCSVIDAANVDLKGFNDGFYKKVAGGKLDPVLRTLEIMREEGVWLEVTRLVVPTLSDALDDIRTMVKWIIRTLGPGTPLHLSRFHPAYKLTRLPPTPIDVLDRAREIALDAGMHFVYVGNAPGHAAQDTICPHCGETAIKRSGYRIASNQIHDGRCACGESIPGIWQ